MARARREQARKIAWEVSERIRDATSPGLGKWPPTWEIVTGPSDRFMDALYQWETSGARDDLEAVRRGAEALVLAWRRADIKFHVSRLQDAPEAVGLT